MLSEQMDKVKGFLNSRTGIIVSIGVIVLLAAGVFAFLFLSGGESTEPAAVQVPKTQGAAGPVTGTVTPTTAVSTGQMKRASDALADLELFQLKDPFIPLVTEEVPKNQAEATSDQQQAAQLTKAAQAVTGAPIVQ